MVNPTSCYKNNNEVNINKNIKKDINYSCEIANEENLKEEFNKEIEIVKEKLEEKIKDYIPRVPDYSKKHFSIEEESIINEGKYAVNNNNVDNLIRNISTIQQVELKVNNNTPPVSHSLRDFFSEVKSTIVAGKHDYLDVLKNNFSSYMNYVNDLRNVISTLTQYTKSASKDGYLSVNFKLFHEKLSEIKNKYENMTGENSFFYAHFIFEHENHGVYTREINGSKLSYRNKNQVNDAIMTIEKVLKELKGIQITKVDKEIKENIDIKLIANVDLSDFNKFIDSIDTSVSEIKGILSDEELKKKEEEITKKHNDWAIVGSSFGVPIVLNRESINIVIDCEVERIRVENDRKKEEAKCRNILQTEFDLFKKSLDTLEKRINTNLEELSKKYSAANSNFDNFIKIVSSTMNTLLEMAKGFLRF
ncbi:SipD family cell invasion protein [Proteus hauseri ATCC 700826]|uniref:SipD family cell invasion protein n=1 Tax=Proteus hauseri ATCC 700826 TaxID=1354271 RepID=A0AAJ3LSE9_PROHU|nr:IpaD/SipD/SspD family type III secretion system needle tip protein [Proteus hauseri]OAT44955.1 SipD family cell invasion protein [Proteus hauseri ATCC 700826]